MVPSSLQPILNAPGCDELLPGIGHQLPGFINPNSKAPRNLPFYCCSVDVCALNQDFSVVIGCLPCNCFYSG
jgi:hypothetical protein